MRIHSATVYTIYLYMYVCMYVYVRVRTRWRVFFKNKVMGNGNNRFSRTRFYVHTHPYPFLTTEFNDSAVVAFIARFYFFVLCPAWRGAAVGSKSRFRVQFLDHVWSLNNSFPLAPVRSHCIYISYDINRILNPNTYYNGNLNVQRVCVHCRALRSRRAPEGPSSFNRS